MKMAIMFAVASLMLVGAVIVFALPTPVQAAKKTEWCTQNPMNVDPSCFNGKGQCEKFRKDSFPAATPECREQPV